MTSPEWRTATNILCVRLDYLGDVLMMTPAIRALKSSHPDRRITLLSSSCGAAIAPLIPEIDDVIVYEAPWMKSGKAQADIDASIAALLNARRFDGVVIFTTYSQSALPAAMLCYQAGIPLRLAYCRENPYLLLTDWIKETEPSNTIRHEVRRQLDLVETIGCQSKDERLSLQVPDDMHAAMERRLESLHIDAQDTWILLHPGASAASRRYPAHMWREAVLMLAEHLHCPMLFAGAAEEVELIDSIMAGIPNCHSLAGMLNIGELAALIDAAPLLIANNSGPAHIAAAVDTPVVSLYALTNPQHTPWLVLSRILFHDVPCRYCYKSVCPEGHHECLTKVTPETVVDAALDLLNETCAVRPLVNMAKPSDNAVRITY
jgi:lipopolysaccharide heptosyltransferase II